LHLFCLANGYICTGLEKYFAVLIFSKYFKNLFYQFFLDIYSYLIIVLFIAMDDEYFQYPRNNDVTFSEPKEVI